MTTARRLRIRLWEAARLPPQHEQQVRSAQRALGHSVSRHSTLCGTRDSVVDIGGAVDAQQRAGTHSAAQCCEPAVSSGSVAEVETTRPASLAAESGELNGPVVRPARGRGESGPKAQLSSALAQNGTVLPLVGRRQPNWAAAERSTYPVLCCCTTVHGWRRTRMYCLHSVLQQRVLPVGVSSSSSIAPTNAAVQPARRRRTLWRYLEDRLLYSTAREHNGSGSS